MTCTKVVAVEVHIEKIASGGRMFLVGCTVAVEPMAKADVEGESGVRTQLIVDKEEPWHVKKGKLEDEEEHA